MLGKIQKKYSVLGMKISSFCGAYKAYGWNKFKNTEKVCLNKITTNEQAQGILEYGIIIALVSLAVLGGIGGLKNAILNQLSNATQKIG